MTAISHIAARLFRRMLPPSEVHCTALLEIAHIEDADDVFSPPPATLVIGRRNRHIDTVEGTDHDDGEEAGEGRRQGARKLEVHERREDGRRVYRKDGCIKVVLKP